MTMEECGGHTTQEWDALFAETERLNAQPPKKHRRHYVYGAARPVYASTAIVQPSVQPKVVKTFGLVNGRVVEL